jgi:ATP-binding protein involved in chromosome partitioning
MLTEEQKEKIDLENKKIAENLGHIKHRIVIFSGKGGVGKTTVSVNLAYGLHSLGYDTGILDADVTGPNVPKMVGMSEQLHIQENRINPHLCNGVKIVSMANFISADQAVIWRGPMRSKLLNQFLSDVAWGDLDYLIADLPPGTGDEILTMTQKMEPDMAIIVTTPQEVSLIDSKRAICMAQKMEIQNIGLIENMSGLLCPECGHHIDLFGSGGGSRQAKEMGVQFLGSIPIDIEVRKLSDEGKQVITENKKSDVSISLLNITDSIIEMLNPN